METRPGVSSMLIITIPRALLKNQGIIFLINEADYSDAKIMRNPKYTQVCIADEAEIPRADWDEIIPLFESGLTVHNSQFSSQPVPATTINEEVPATWENAYLPETTTAKQWQEYARIITANNTSDSLIGFGQVDFGTDNWTQPTTHEQLLAWMDKFPDWYCRAEQIAWKKANTLEEEI